MSRESHASVIVAALCATSLVAQGTHTISPAGHNLSAAATSTGYPWGYAASTYSQFRYQQIHDDLAGSPRVLLGLAIRRIATGAVYAAFTSTLQLDLSTAAVPSQAATSTYATNHGANKAAVMTTRVVNFVAVNPPTNNVPAPMTYVLPFDQPYIHTGTGGICWEVLMTANTNPASISFDLAYNGVARNQAYGTGCGGASLTGSYAAPTLTQTATGLTPNTSAAFLIGADNVTFAGQPLPLDLGFINAAGCKLWVDLLVAVSVPVDAAGTATLQTSVASLPPFSVCIQVAAPSAAIPFGVGFSNGLHASPSLPRTFMRNWNSVTTSATGSLQLTYALVTDFLQP